MPVNVFAAVREAMLVRVLAEWEGPCPLPSVPPGHVVTATASSLGLVGVLVELELRGYRGAGIHPAPLAPPHADVVDLLVPAALPRSAPDWWQTVLACAERVFPLDYGPVWAILRDLLAVHLATEPVAS